MTKIRSQSISMDLNYQVVINGELLNNIDYIKCIYCNEKDESKLLKKTYKNRIICENCYNIIINMTKPFKNNNTK